MFREIRASLILRATLIVSNIMYLLFIMISGKVTSGSGIFHPAVRPGRRSDRENLIRAGCVL